MHLIALLLTSVATFSSRADHAQGAILEAPASSRSFFLYALARLFGRTTLSLWRALHYGAEIYVDAEGVLEEIAQQYATELCIQVPDIAVIGICDKPAARI